MLSYYIRAARPQHYLKNLFVFAPLIFAERFYDLNSNINTFITFIIFSLSASAVYYLNDLFDKTEDAKHPIKKYRPIASGNISVCNVILIYILLSVISLFIAFFWLNISTVGIILIYLILNILYSWKLKHIVLLDVFIVSSGFVLRILAGGFSINAHISEWLILCVILLSLFLALAKRRQELLSTNSIKKNITRKVLDDYTETLLDQLIAITAGLSITSYSLYTILNKNFENLIYTVPIVIYGIFRYLYLIYKKGSGANPEKELYKDKHILFSIIIWVSMAVIFISYGQ